MKGLVTRNAFGKYESPISFTLKVMTKVQMFQKQVKFKVKVTM